jgi:hypothetical protein
MFRRQFMSVIGSSIAPAIIDGWQQKYQREIVDSDSTGSELEDFLVPIDALRGEWEFDMDRDRLAPTDSEKTQTEPVRGWSQSRAPWNQDRWISHDYARNHFSIIDEETDTIHAQLTSQVLKPSLQSDDTPTVDELHRFALWKSFNGPPTEDSFTDWVDGNIIQRKKTDYRRTEAWFQIPILHRDPTTCEHPNNNRPYEERVVIIATTPWGVLDLGHAVVNPQERQQTLSTARELIKPLYQRALEHSPKEVRDDAN